MSEYAAEYLAESRAIGERLDSAAIDRLAAALAGLRERDGRLFLLGNGGGAAHASHAAADFRKLCGIDAHCPGDNPAALTAAANDDGWANAHAALLRLAGLCGKDAVLVVSVGGGDLARGVSANLALAAEDAKTRAGCQVLAIVGRDGGRIAEVADVAVVIPTVNARRVTPHVEGWQSVLLHLLTTHPLLNRGTPKWESIEPSS